MDCIYKLGLSVNMFGKKTRYSFTVLRCNVKSQTKDNVILHDSRRIKKENLDKIIDGFLTNSSRNINYVIWTFDLSKQELYKKQLVGKITFQIEKYKQELIDLEQAMLSEPQFTELDRE